MTDTTNSSSDHLDNNQENVNHLYLVGKQYWSTIEPTIDGMLGGFSQLCTSDISQSEQFLRLYFDPLDENNSTKPRRALDCGSGIGRITKNLLLRYFTKIDLLEQNEQFLIKARDYIGSDVFDQRVSTICNSLHRFEAKEDIKYDLIWCQWVTGHLTDKDFVQFLNQCKQALQPNGLIVIKDNHTSGENTILDSQDGSVTRTYPLILSIFKQAQLKIINEKRQNKFPKGIFPVKMFALQS